MYSTGRWWDGGSSFVGRKERSAMMGVVGQDEGAGVVDCGLFEGGDGAMS